MELREFADEIKRIYQIQDNDFYEKFSCMMADNNWFGIQPTREGNSFHVNPQDFAPYMSQIEYYFLDADDEEKEFQLEEEFSTRFQDTYGKFLKFAQDVDLPSSYFNPLISFMLKFLQKDISLYSDNEVQDLLETAFYELSKGYGSILTFFLTWCKENYRTRYHNDYTMNERRTNENNGAYEFEEYLEMIYYLFNEDYIENNAMLVKAANSKNYVDTWLFLALHFVCALRNSDLVRIYHPKLPYTPEEVLQQVIDGEFKAADAEYTLSTIIWRMNVMPLKPNKTQHHQGIANVKFFIPESLKVLFGMLFAIAEAHYQLENPNNPEEPLIRIIGDYQRITRYMGDDIGALFLESNFRSRSANKSYLQSIDMLADKILDNDEEFNTKGYMLAAIARSHKGSYGQFAQTTVTYIKDAKLSGLSAEFVARELFERGVLSFIPSMLLNIISNGDFRKLSVTKQTALIQQLGLTPNEIEYAVGAAYRTKQQASIIVRELVRTENENILSILHQIGNGTAASKQPECLCLLTAMHRKCPYVERHHCIGCKYEISTKSTVFLLTTEYKRLLYLYQSANDINLKKKYKSLLLETVLPCLDETLSCISETYGNESIEALERIVEENVYG